jgi:4-diphosphocytidyl-2-C-methyl-D-erythritol kinase
LVFAEHPEIKTIKEELYKQGAVYAAMSGSGSSVYGLFEKNTQLQFHFPEYYFIRQI